MNIEKLINELSKNIGKTIMHKKEDSTEIINLDNCDSTNMLWIVLKGLVYRQEYNKAENILFEEININKSLDIYNVAIDFYDLLFKETDKELERGNFSREEIFQGLRELNNIFNISN
ncbi:DUF6483 family protein [Clostridium sp. DSM 100503]|uniref:DUF6483 family protein n=1 Tax=Clostridium sp. DSM 100503 TaxID=2963282 RepID=UPI002149C50B|nr:DUF6483 family protein [Clostridium sp. DSM 100503]MCR1949819.1 DUF6483 family protein [Clostridium sp. DSM 100503]